MKKIRAVCLLLSLGALLANPQAVRAEEETCCNELAIFCDGFCYEHEGVIMVDCHVGMSCSEVCACGDGHDYFGPPNYCAPCG